MMAKLLCSNWACFFVFFGVQIFQLFKVGNIVMCHAYESQLFIVILNSVLYFGVMVLILIRGNDASEPPHDKTNKMAVRPAKIQISPGIRPVWSESSLSAWRKLGSFTTLWAHSRLWSNWADAQADLSLRWAHIPFCCFCLEAAHIHLNLYFKLFTIYHIVAYTGA